MLKEITTEEMEEIVKESPNDMVVIFNETNNQWYDIRGLSMEEVGREIQKMSEKGVFDTKEK